ncbi:MAG: YHYH protein [Acidobacteria bacterium]|nr:YHYH protein [Acidobacteriota bacterium]
MVRTLFLLVVARILSADPATASWIRAQPADNEALRRALPEVHRVWSDEAYAYVESAGLSMQSFGMLETRPEEEAPRKFVYRIPRAPQPAKRPAAAPAVAGTFINGVPIYSVNAGPSFRGQNLWHADSAATASRRGPAPPLLAALLRDTGRHSPLIGYAIDGFPIYGPYGWDDAGRLRRFRSSYRIRNATRRTARNRVELTPAQEGPAAGPQFPAGTFAEDYEFSAGGGDLDEHNGRFARTPEYPGGTYAYFLATSPHGEPEYPYLTGPSLRGEFQPVDLASYQAAGEDNGLKLHRRGSELIFETPHPVLETVHERPMHVIAVSSDLSIFDHVHPEPIGAGLYQLRYDFGPRDTYWIFAGYTAPGAAHTVSRFTVTGGGQRRSTAPPAAVSMTYDGPLETGRDIRFRFKLPSPDIEPFLGSWAHVMIISRDKREFIHAHPQEETPPAEGPWKHSHLGATPPTEIETSTGFSHPGRYRLWFQVKRAGEVLTFPFDIEVAPGRAVTTAPPPGDAVRITVNGSGYTPARITIPDGRPVRLAIHRVDAQNCASSIIFAGLGITRALPPGQITVIELPPQPAGEVTFACGMGMYRGAALVKTRTSEPPASRAALPGPGPRRR